jgi:hypothetical protein
MSLAPCAHMPCAHMPNLHARLARGNPVEQDVQGVGMWASKTTKEQASHAPQSPSDARQSSLDAVMLPRSCPAASPAPLSPLVRSASNDTGTSAGSPVLHGAPGQLGDVCGANTTCTDHLLAADLSRGSLCHGALVRGQGEEEHAQNINVLLAHPVVVRAMQNARLDGILTRLLGLLCFLRALLPPLPALANRRATASRAAQCARRCGGVPWRARRVLMEPLMRHDDGTADGHPSW